MSAPRSGREPSRDRAGRPRHRGEESQEHQLERDRRAGRPGHAVPDRVDGPHRVQAVAGDLLADPAADADAPHARQLLRGDRRTGIRDRFGVAVLPQQPRRNTGDRAARLPGLAARLGPGHAADRADDPGQALIIALFLDFNRLGLLATVPKELEEAAAIDGASAPTIFWRILFPLVKPGLVATSIVTFITAYNEFIVALTFLAQAHSTYTLPTRRSAPSSRRRPAGRC